MSNVSLKERIAIDKRKLAGKERTADEHRRNDLEDVTGKARDGGVPAERTCEGLSNEVGSD